jgi:hypothetical protein
MIETHYGSYKGTQLEAARWEAQLKDDVASYYAGDTASGDADSLTGTGKVAGSSLTEEESYLAILMLSLRQILASNVITRKHPDISKPTIFQKEISSDGKTNTVDVIHPAMPFYLYANPEMLRLLLDPVFEYQEAGLFQHYGKFAMHDIGLLYSYAKGYDDSNRRYHEDMPVEESGNMILMAYAYYKATNNSAYLASHYTIPPPVSLSHPI